MAYLYGGRLCPAEEATPAGTVVDTDRECLVRTVLRQLVLARALVVVPSAVECVVVWVAEYLPASVS